MSTISITNQVASQAIRGQNVVVTVDLSSQSAEFIQVNVGQQCSIQGQPIYGEVFSVDSYGNSFEIVPLQPNLNMSSIRIDGTYTGYLNSGEIIDITL